MGRGPGIAQRAILAALEADQGNAWLTVPELAERTGRPPRQVRTAVHALEARGLVVITKGATGWKGRGDYGRWVYAQPGDAADPRVVTVQPGDPIPHRPGWEVLASATQPVTFIRAGVPVSGLQVWLTATMAASDEEYRRAIAAIEARLSRPG
jgi:hypothetical protein